VQAQTVKGALKSNVVFITDISRSINDASFQST